MKKTPSKIRKAVIPAAAPVVGLLCLETYGHADEKCHYGVALVLEVY